MYIIINNLAIIRSGWPPQPKIINMIGTKLSSNKIYKNNNEHVLKKKITITPRIKVNATIGLEEIKKQDFPIDHSIKIEIIRVNTLRVSEI